MKKIVMQKELSVISPISGFGQNETDEEPLRVCRKRKSKQVAATLDSVVESRCSSRIHGLSSVEKLNLIDFDCHLENMWRELPEDKKNLFACLDSMWFVLYRTKDDKPKVLRWIKSRDIFSKKYVFVPIVLWGHWCLLIFCHLGESLESKSTTPCMLLLDSLQMADPLRFEPEIRKFVSSIFNNEERPESLLLIKKIQLLVPKVPQQRSNIDSRKFVLYYISRFLESAPETFSISEGYPYFMKEDWFTPDQLESFWQELQTLTKDSESSDGRISGFGQKETDEEPLRVCRERKSKQVAATLDSAVEPRRSSHIHGLSNRRNDRSVEKLNSLEFDCYLENMWRELPEDKKNSFACLDSMWFALYRTKDYKPKVLRWIKSKDIFSKKYVFVPIVLWGHWCLLIFCHLGESLESESTTPCMLLLDSLQIADPLRFAPEIRKFVSGIFNNEERPESPGLIKKIQLLVPQVPQQRNDTDCGKFVLYYISLFLESAPETFSISEGYPYFMKEDWFTLEQLESFWQEVKTSGMKDSASSDGSSSDSDDVICLD